MPEVSTQAILELLDRKSVESVPILKYFTEDLLPVKSDSKISLRKLKELLETQWREGLISEVTWDNTPKPHQPLHK
ncbi:MAG: hypothetical protein QXF06_04490 [Archaeoglobaceae archaeon]